VKSTIIILGVLLPVFVGSAVLFTRDHATAQQVNGSRPGAAGDQQPPATGEPVPAVPDGGTPSGTSLVGMAVPAMQVQVRAQVDGVLLQCRGSAGQLVEAGQVLASFDDSDLALEAQRLDVKSLAAKHHVESAEAELSGLESRHEQVLQLRQQNAASPFEETQSRYAVAAVSAKVKALEQEQKEQLVQSRIADRQRQKYRCLAPISGRIVELTRVANEYVKEGEVIAKIQSEQWHVSVDLPSAMAQQSERLAFSYEDQGRRIELNVVELKPISRPDGKRPATLAVPAGVQLVAGQPIWVKVNVKP